MGSFRGTRAECAGALVLFAALTVLLTYPLSLRPGSTSLGSDPDVHTFTWTLGWDAHALATRPWDIFDANIFHPYDRTLAFSENLLGSAIFAAPVIWLTGNYVLAMNLVALLSVVLCGLGAFLLARRLGLSLAAAIIAGLVFAFSPARFFRFAQIHLTAVQWMPFALACLHGYFNTGKRRDLLLAIGFFTLQVYASLHGGVFLGLAIGVVLLYRMVETPTLLWRAARDAGLAGASLLAPVVLLAIPYLQVQREAGLVRTLENWIPAPESFLASPTHLHSWLWRTLLDTPINERASAFLFPGVLALVLATSGLTAVRQRCSRDTVIVYGGLALLGVLLAAGPPISIWPQIYWLPGFNFIRIPSRFFLLTVLGVSILAALGFDRLTRSRGPRTRVVLGIAAAVLLVVESAAIPLPLTPYQVSFPAADRWLASQRRPFAVAEVPVGNTARYHSTYMLHSMAHWERTVHAHSSVEPPLHQELYARLRTFPDRASLDLLEQLQVTYVVVHQDMYRPEEWPAVDTALSRYGERLTAVYADESSRVYRILRSE